MRCVYVSICVALASLALRATLIVKNVCGYMRLYVYVCMYVCEVALASLALRASL